MRLHHSFVCVVGLVALAFAPLFAQEAQRVGVGAYPFLPFVSENQHQGVTSDLIAAMNAHQSKYRFELVPTSANRRYVGMQSGQFSVMFFENLAWGWDAQSVEASNVFLRGDGEVFVARRAPGRGQAYFESLADKEILGVLGYHYAFANFEADQKVLAKRFRMTFGKDNEVSLRRLLMGNGDVAIVTRSFLQVFLRQHPQHKAALLISDRYDQTYAHSILVKKGGQPNVQEINDMLAGMKKSGALKTLWAKHGIQE